MTFALFLPNGFACYVQGDTFMWDRARIFIPVVEKIISTFTVDESDVSASVTCCSITSVHIDPQHLDVLHLKVQIHF